MRDAMVMMSTSKYEVTQKPQENFNDHILMSIQYILWLCPWLMISMPDMTIFQQLPQVFHDKHQRLLHSTFFMLTPISIWVK